MKDLPVRVHDDIINFLVFAFTRHPTEELVVTRMLERRSHDETA